MFYGLHTISSIVVGVVDREYEDRAADQFITPRTGLFLGLGGGVRALSAN